MAYWVQYIQMDQELKLKEDIKKELADFLGLEPEDIEDDSFLSEDLHMQASDITDFIQKLTSLNYLTSNLDLTEIETFDDLIESISNQN